MMKRFQQQIILPEIGVDGQQKIFQASVLVVGAGGLGVVVCSYLVAMGIGKVGICDYDNVEESNLHRQFCYNPNDIGINKASVLAQKLKIQNPEIVINDFKIKIDELNIEEIAKDYQLICDCTDKGGIRMIINNYSEKHKKPLIHGAVSDWQGYITVFHYKKNIGLTDIFDSSEYFNIQNCTIIGVNSAVCGLIGSYMVNETIKIVLNLDNVLDGKLLYINTLNNFIRTIKLKNNTL